MSVWDHLKNDKMNIPSHFENIFGIYTDEDVKEVEEKLFIAKNHFLLKAPFFGVLAVGMKLINSSQWLATVATDSRDFYYNVGFLKMLTPLGVQFCFAHTILHCAYEHFNRSEIPMSTLDKLFPDEELTEEDKRKLYKMIYSVAADYAVNRDVANMLMKAHEKNNNHNIKKITDVIIPSSVIPLYYDEKYKESSTEDILIDLLKATARGENPLAKGMTLDDHALLGRMGEGNGQSKLSNGSPGSGNGEDDPSYYNGMPRMTDEEREKAMADFQQNMFQAYELYQQSLSGGRGTAGTVPGEVERYIGRLKNPEINWRQYINSRFISKFQSNDESWSQLDRRSFDDDLVMPGAGEREKVEIVIMLDYSGSISDEMITDFVTEIYGLACQYDDYEITVWCFDGIVRERSKKIFTKQNISELPEYRGEGGGGTNFLANWHYMKENNMKPKLLVMFTDGYTADDYGVPGFAETIYVVNSEVVVPEQFGTTIRYRNRDYKY